MQIQAADYPLQVEPAQVLGFDCGLGAGLRICIFFGNKTQKTQTASMQSAFFHVLGAWHPGPCTTYRIPARAILNPESAWA